jgi:hypothetical protein
MRRQGVQALAVRSMSAEEEEMERLLKQRRDRRDVFGEVISDYERLRGLSCQAL